MSKRYRSIEKRPGTQYEKIEGHEFVTSIQSRRADKLSGERIPLTAEVEVLIVHFISKNALKFSHFDEIFSEKNSRN